MDKGVKQLRNKSVQLVQVASGRGGEEDYTWEMESGMRNDCLELFSCNEFCGQNYFKRWVVM